MNPNNLTKQKPQRIQKLIANAGYASRRKIESLILQQKVKINNKIAKLGDLITVCDTIAIDDKVIDISNKLVLATKILIYNKKEGEVCSHSQHNNCPTIYESLPKLSQGKWISVGRLDINTCGLIFITNDGKLANQLMHPKFSMKRVYKVRLKGKFDAKLIAKLKKPTDIGKGEFGKFDEINFSPELHKGHNFWLKVTLSQGKYREIKRLFATIDMEVSRLIRIEYAGVKLPKGLPSGRYHMLDKNQINAIKAKIKSQIASQNKQP